MKELLSYLVGVFDSRYTTKEKNNFIIYLNNYFKNYKHPLRLIKYKSILSSINDIFVGDTKNCRILLVAPYDTPEKVFTKFYKYNPANLDSHKAYQKMTIIIKIAMLLTTVYIAYTSLKDSSLYNSTQRIIATLISIIMFALTTIYGKGISNKHNASQSSAIATAISSFEVTKNKASLLLCDLSNSTGYGLKKFISENESFSNLPLIYIDSITPDGEIRIYAYRENIKAAKDLSLKIEGSKTIEIFGESCISNSEKNAILISTTKEYKNGFFVPNVKTKNDYDVDIDRLEIIKNGIISYINETF